MKGNNRFDVKVLDRKTGFEKIEKLWVPAGHKTPKMSATKISQPPLSTTKTKNIKVKHPKRKLYRSSDPLLSVFMWGINHTVRELTHISVPVMLMPDDFKVKQNPLWNFLKWFVTESCQNAIREIRYGKCEKQKIEKVAIKIILVNF